MAARAAMLAEAHETVKSVFHSPYTRTTQTASIMAEKLSAPCEVMHGLIPDGSVDEIITALLDMELPALLVSHLPLVDDLCYALTGRQVGFQPGTIVKIQLNNALAATNPVVSIHRS